jgi:proline iminopeptidase
VGRLVPEEWARFRDAVPEAERDGSLVDAYARLLADPDPAVREKAAADWCEWEDTHVAIGSPRTRTPRYEDPAFRMCFARLVTHYWRHAAWLDDGELVRGADRLAGIPGVLIHGRVDISSPPDVAWQIARVWPDAELVLVDGAGHGTSDAGMAAAVVAATDRFAARM